MSKRRMLEFCATPAKTMELLWPHHWPWTPPYGKGLERTSVHRNQVHPLPSPDSKRIK